MPPPGRGKSVTHVPGMICYLSLGKDTNCVRSQPVLRQRDLTSELASVAHLNPAPLHETGACALFVLLYRTYMRRTYLGELEQIVLLAILRTGTNAYGVTIRQEIEDRTGRV